MEVDLVNGVAPGGLGRKGYSGFVEVWECHSAINAGEVWFDAT